MNDPNVQHIHGLPNYIVLDLISSILIDRFAEGALLDPLLTSRYSHIVNQASIGHEGLLWLQHVAYCHATEIGYMFHWCCMRKSYTHQIFTLDSSWPTHT